MMELDMWNSFPLAVDWSLSQPVDHSGGLFGDIKTEGYLCGDDALGLHLQDAVEHVPSQSTTKNEDILAMEWMESDLGSFLEVMGNSHDKLLPLEASLIEYTYSTAPEESVTFDEPGPKYDSTTKGSGKYTSLEHFLTTPLNDGDACTEEGFDALFSPPRSPEQVAPVIKMEPVVGTHPGPVTGNVIHDTSLVDLFGDAFEATVAEHSLIFGGLDLASGDDTGSSVVTFDDASELISSPLSADDVESMLSGSMPSSPSASQSSIIESSPELYKVILTSSIECIKRFSPYSRLKASKQPKAADRSQPTAVPIPDHIIGEMLNKKDRKKLQNKNAAIRYRMKKKEEAAGIKTEEQILEEHNLELRTKVEDLQREIKYMKNLMEDVCRAKGIHLKP